MSNRFIHCNNKSTFEQYKSSLPDDSIVFIKETKEIYTHGLIYPCPYTEELLNDLLNNKADIDDLSNVLAEEVVDRDTYQEFDKLNRENLKKDLFIDLWNAACRGYGKYNDKTEYFELNGLTDITYKQAIDIYNYYCLSSDFADNESRYNYVKIRTNLPFSLKMKKLGQYAFTQCPLEAIYLTGPQGLVELIGMGHFFYSEKIHTIIGAIHITNNTNAPNCFNGTTSLKNVKIKISKNNFRIIQSSLLTLESMRYLVDNSISDVNITIHENIYNAMLGQANYPFNEGTKEEWTKLLEDAINKQITFSTVL